MNERHAIERLKEEILEELNGDDLGLWEPLWTLNGWYPDEDERSREAVAEKALRQLCERPVSSLFIGCPGLLRTKERKFQSQEAK